MKFSTLSEKDRRTARVAAIGLGIYLALFFGWRAFGFLSRRHAEYRQLQAEAKALLSRLDLYGARAARVERLMETFQLDPAHLSKTTLVARASEAIQQTAALGGVQLVSLRETLNAGAEREFGAFQLEAMGPVPALMGFLHRLRGLGFPLVIDALQISTDPRGPGMIKINVGLILLNYEQWEKKGAPDV